MDRCWVWMEEGGRTFFRPLVGLMGPESYSKGQHIYL